MMVSIFVLSISLSIDALGIGFSYGTRGIIFSRWNRVAVGIVTSAVMWLSLQMGTVLLQFYPVEVLQIIGTSVLVLMGVVYIRRGLMQKEDAFCDMNQSKTIEWWEMLLLAIALSSDSISAGIAVAAMGMQSVWLPVMVGVMQTVFLETGILCYRCMPGKKLGKSRVYGVFAGILLIGMGFFRMLQ